MALTAAAQMCSGVGKSGSPRLKSKTATPCGLELAGQGAGSEGGRRLDGGGHARKGKGMVLPRHCSLDPWCGEGCSRAADVGRQQGHVSTTDFTERGGAMREDLAQGAAPVFWRAGTGTAAGHAAVDPRLAAKDAVLAGRLAFCYSSSTRRVARPAAVALRTTALRRSPRVEGRVRGAADRRKGLAAIVVRASAAGKAMRRPPAQQTAAVGEPAANGPHPPQQAVLGRRAAWRLAANPPSGREQPEQYRSHPHRASHDTHSPSCRTGKLRLAATRLTSSGGRV